MQECGIKDLTKKHANTKLPFPVVFELYFSYPKWSFKEAVRPSDKFISFNLKFYWEFNGGDHFCQKCTVKKWRPF